MFYEEVKIKIISGNGGNGNSCILKTKHNKYYKFNGGNGGNAGNIYIMADKNIYSLMHYFYKKKFFSKNGFNGGCFLKTGKNSKDLILRVPLGTLVKNINNNIILDLVKNKEKFLLINGGLGGLGNFNFKYNWIFNSKKYGSKGECKVLKLELKLFSEINLLGFPNTGKSSFFNNVTNNKSKISNYNFTTLIPIKSNLNIKLKKNFYIIDIPGIIKNSYSGNGLGLKFLVHLERTKIILHFVDLYFLNFNIKKFIKNIYVINNELYKFNKISFYKPRWLIFNKIDFFKIKFIKIFNKKLLKIFNWYNKFFFISSLKKTHCRYICNIIYNNLFI